MLEIVNEYASYLLYQKNYSKKTIDSYTRDINKFLEFMNNENENIKNKLFNKSLEEEYLLTKTKLSYVCEDCFNKLDKNILLPFNQRIKNKECQCCKNKASKCYFIIN